LQLFMAQGVKGSRIALAVVCEAVTGLLRVVARARECVIQFQKGLSAWTVCGRQFFV
jgi:hypothetical protein